MSFSGRPSETPEVTTALPLRGTLAAVPAAVREKVDSLLEEVLTKSGFMRIWLESHNLKYASWLHNL